MKIPVKIRIMYFSFVYIGGEQLMLFKNNSVKATYESGIMGITGVRL